MINKLEKPLLCSLTDIDKLLLCDPEVKTYDNVAGWNATRVTSTKVCLVTL